MNNDLIIAFHDLNNQVLTKLIRIETTIKMLNIISVLSLLFSSSLFVISTIMENLNQNLRFLICVMILSSTITLFVSITSKRKADKISRQFTTKFGWNLGYSKEIVYELCVMNAKLDDSLLIRILG